MERVVHIENLEYNSTLTRAEKEIIYSIKESVKTNNIDNISRTEAYLRFYKEHRDIKWSFLAHMVSRNAGWNMCDLEGKWLPKTVGEKERALLFKTYERANWLIFQDAYPQLLLYHYSTKIGVPMFHLLKFFHVSNYMEKEWVSYFCSRDEVKLLIALVINEQNVIQEPVINHPLYKKRVFNSLLFSFQDWFHYSCVLFPTRSGVLLGASVNGFRSVDKRIDLGKRLASILFHRDFYPSIYDFAKTTIHTGSRIDYEQYFERRHLRTTPLLRDVFPIVTHHIHHFEDWSKTKRVKHKWESRSIKYRHPVQITSWYKHKQRQLHRSILIKQLIFPKIKKSVRKVHS